MILSAVLIFFVFLGVLLVRAARFTPVRHPPPGSRDLPGSIDLEKAAEKLSAAVRIQTLSVQDYSRMNPEPFLDFHRFLEQAYPKIHAHLEKTIVNRYALVYHWEGRRPDLPPIALLAHMDVVPVEPETMDQWESDPFGGKISDGFIWGRGTLDMKGSLTAIMESVEILLAAGKVPERTVYLLFGHDEESGGSNGAAKIAEYLKSVGVTLAYTVDEGMVVLSPEASPTRGELGIIGLGEKGYVSVHLNAGGPGGHSSSPPSKTAIGTLCRACANLEKKPMPARMTPPVREFFDVIARQMGFGRKLLFANQWLFSPLIRSLLSKSGATSPMLRTTAAPTMIQGGVKENILPTKASLTMNFRILPGDTIQSVVKYVKHTINDPDIRIELLPGVQTDPPPISSADGDGYRMVEKTLRQVFPKALTAPGLVWAMTDSRHYAGISENNFRFAPFRFGPADLPRIHGINERVAVPAYGKAIEFYTRLILNAAVYPDA